MSEHRAYRWLRRLVAWLLPVEFDRRWGAEIARTSVERGRDARASGPMAWSIFLVREALSLLTLSVRARTHPAEVPRTVRSSVMFEPEDNRPLRIAWVVAILIHFVAFTAVIPFEGRTVEAMAEEELTVIQKYEPPAPPEQQPVEPIRKRRARPVPIPDPTPDQPEPMMSEAETEWLESEEAPEVMYELGPPAGPPEPTGEQLFRPGPHIQRPEILERVEPEYPELARRARLTCTVILEAHIGKSGDVLDVEILRPCAMGMDEAAVGAVSQWKYAPTLVDGRPVEVALTVTVVFKLQ